MNLTHYDLIQIQESLEYRLSRLTYEPEIKRVQATLDKVRLMQSNREVLKDKLREIAFSNVPR